MVVGGEGSWGSPCVHASGWQASSELRGAFPCLGEEGKINKLGRLYKERQGGNRNVEIPEGKSASLPLVFLTHARAQGKHPGVCFVTMEHHF